MPLHRFAVVSVAPPTIRTHCRSCGADRRFACRERFRVNASGKLVDIWLLYRCVRCDVTRNVTLVERTPVRRVRRDLLDAAYDNDAAVARRVARDAPLLRRAGVTIESGDEWMIVDGAAQVPSSFELALDEPLLVRLDTVLAALLGIGRRAARETVTVDGCSTRFDGLRLWRTVTVHQRRQPLVGPEPVGVPVDGREDHQLLHPRPFGQRRQLAPHGLGTSGDRRRPP